MQRTPKWLKRKAVGNNVKSDRNISRKLFWIDTSDSIDVHDIETNLIDI